jgi:hypothetical protein
MAADIRQPDEAQRKAFVEKLGQFRDSLSADEQGILDIMVATILAPRDDGDVQAYQEWWTQFSGYPAGGYTWGYLQPWTNNGYQQTAYGTA